MSFNHPGSRWRELEADERDTVRVHALNRYKAAQERREAAR